MAAPQAAPVLVQYEVDMIEERPIDELGALVVARFEKARSAKSPHYTALQECMKLMQGEPLTRPDKDSPDVNTDIASPIIKGLVALINDVFIGNLATPYTINASPVSELPESLKQELLSRIEADLETMVMMAQGDVSKVREQISDYRSVLMLEENRRAAAAAEKLTTIIADRLHDAGWEDVFAQFIQDYCIYSCAFMKAPSIVEKRRMRWVGDSVEPTTDLVRTVENISPFDFFPAPHAQDIQTADYVIERRRMTRNELLALRHAAGYDADVIDEIFEDAPNGSVLPYIATETGGVSDTLGLDSDTDSDIYDALGYYGRIRNEVLAEYGIEFLDDEKAGTSEAEIWVVAGRVIKCLLNPDPLGKRPFYKASFEIVPGSFWGISPAMKLRDIQKICTASTRSLVKNFKFSSGPIGEVTKGRVKDGMDVTAIIPNTVRLVTDDNFGNGQPAYRFYTVPSQINELSALFDRYHNLAYEVLGLSRLAFGQSQGLGAVGRTSGGVSILLNQSTKSIKYAMRMLEQGLIEPVVQDFVDYELRTSDDPEIRGDIRVYARGVSGLMQKESDSQNLEWALQSLSSMMGVIDPQTQQPIVPPTALQRLLYQLFKNKGIPTQGIFPDFDKEEAFSDLVGGTAVDMNAGMPQLDGRSANAAQAIENANEVI